MAAGAFTLYESAIRDFFNGTRDWDTDTHYMILVDSTYTPNIATHTSYSDVSAHENTDPDYVRQDVASATVTIVGGEIINDAADVDFGTNLTITTRYAVILVGDEAGPLAGDPLVGYMLLDNTPADLAISGTGLIIQWPSTGVFKVTQP